MFFCKESLALVLMSPGGFVCGICPRYRFNRVGRNRRRCLLWVEFSMDPRQRNREAVRLLRVYKDSLERRALAARDTALARLRPDAPGNHLPEYAYKSTNRTALMNVPVDLRLLAAALKTWSKLRFLAGHQSA
jgi:hypothetical protein